MIERERILQSLFEIGRWGGGFCAQSGVRRVTTGANRRLIKPYGWALRIWLEWSVCRAKLKIPVSLECRQALGPRAPRDIADFFLRPLFDIEIPELLSRMKAFYALCVIKSVIVFLARRTRPHAPSEGKSRSAGSLYAILTPRRQRLFAEAERNTTERRRTRSFSGKSTQWKTESRLNGNFGKHRVLENCGSVEDGSDCSLVHQKPLSSSLRVVDVPRSVYCVTFV